MRWPLPVFACVVVASCTCLRAPATAPGPVSLDRPYAPRPPPSTTPGRWDPEPPEVTTALALRGTQPERAEALLLAAAGEAGMRGDERMRAIALHRAGDLALDLGRCEDAQARYLEALALHRARGDLKLLAVAANDLGLMGNACQQDPIAWFQLSVETREQLADPEALRLGLSNLGGAAMLWRPPREARPILERALAVAEANGDVEGRRRTHVNLAATLMYLAREEAARDAGAEPAKAAFAHLEQALALGRQQGLGPEEGGCHGVPTDLWWMCGPRGLGVLGGADTFDAVDEAEQAAEAERLARAQVHLAAGAKLRLAATGVTGVVVSRPGVVDATVTRSGKAVLLRGLAPGEVTVVLSFGERQEEKRVVVR